MYKYYEIIGSIKGTSEVLFGSFERSDCVGEKESESFNWKEEGYKGIKIVSRLTEEHPDPEVYGSIRFRIDFRAVDGPYHKTAGSLREAGEIVLDYVGNYDGFVSFDGIVRCAGITVIHPDGDQYVESIRKAVNLALENRKA